jgi:hypothetical protein
VKSLPVAIVGGAALVAAGVLLAVGLAPAAPPAVLAVATPGATAPAVAAVFDDQRRVDVSFDSGEAVTLTAPVGGVLTRQPCTTAGTLTSGSVVAHVDERPLLGLHTRVPLYRDLQVGDRGDDVRAVQDELSRLGRPVDGDGRLGPRTARVVTALLREAGAELPEAPGVLSRDQVVWLPRPTTATTTCTALGATLAPGDTLASAPAPVTAVRLSTRPRDLAPGDRDLEVLGVTGPLTDESGSTDPDFLAALASANGVHELADDDEVPATLRLREPLAVLQVPAAALAEPDATGAACLAVPGRSLPAEVVGSALGASLVRLPAGVDPPQEVSLRDVDRRRPCR